MSVGRCEDNVVPADERLVVQGADVVFPGVLGGLGEEEGFWGLVGVVRHSCTSIYNKHKLAFLL